jgi:hypothetical protein
MTSWVTISIPRNHGAEASYIEVSPTNPYQAVSAVDLSLPLGKQAAADFGKTNIGEIMPVHNASGIKDRALIGSMSKLARDSHIYQPDGIPNIKLVLAPNRKLLLFDGHHSLISYYRRGFKLLAEVPYLVVTGPNNAPVSAEEISSFFPEKSRQKIMQQWSKYAVNWQLGAEGDIEPRQVSTIAELCDSLGKRDESSCQ